MQEIEMIVLEVEEGLAVTGNVIEMTAPLGLIPKTSGALRRSLFRLLLMIAEEEVVVVVEEEEVMTMIAAVVAG